MRYAIISDIHANPVALEVALADARSHQADRIVCLGDVVGYGPDPVEAVALCRSSCGVVLMGNHGAAVAGVTDTRNFIAFAQDGVRRHSSELNDADKEWLRGLQYVHRDRSILCAHGTPVYPDLFLYMNDAEPVAMSLEWMTRQKKRLLFIGHTHHACTIIYGPDNKLRVAKADEDIVLDRRSTYLVNVGSVGYPRADHDITYVLYDTATRTVTFRHLPFDFDGYVARMEAKNVRLPLWLSDYMRLRAAEIASKGGK